MGALLTPEELFDHLLQRRERITYGSAYVAIVGPRPRKWAQGYAQQVARLAKSTKRVPVSKLQIKLDALVVNRRSGVPSDGHFVDKEYDSATWAAAFHSWPFCDHW